MPIQKVIDPAKIVTDELVLEELTRQGIDKDYVEFFEDYNGRHPRAKFYRDLKSSKQVAVFCVRPKVTKDDKKIVAQWKLSPDGTYYADNNTFSASIDGKGISVDVDDKTASWSPQVFLNGTEVACYPEPTLLGIDPNNETYFNNILEWDYGFCKRRLRLIEGAILELYILDHHPDYREGMTIKGECNKCGKCCLDCRLKNPDGSCSVYDERQERGIFDCIKYPDVDDLLANTAPLECSYWIEYQGEKFQPRDVSLVVKSNAQGNVQFSRPYCSEGILEIVEDEKLFSFNQLINGRPRVWHYPLIIDDSIDVNSTASDGYIAVSDGTYLTAQTQALGETINDTGDFIYAANLWYAKGENYNVSRGFLFFDTSAIGAGATITAAVLSLMFNDGQEPYWDGEANGGQSTVHVVEGVQTDPLQASDYGDERLKTTSGGSIAFGDITLDIYEAITLNATGRGWISLTGTTLFCLRLAGDRGADEPSGTNCAPIWSNEKGNGFWPKLVVTYTPPYSPATRSANMAAKLMAAGLI